MFEILFAEEKAKRGIEAAVRWTSPRGTGVSEAIRQAALEDLVEDLDDSVAYAAARQEDQRNRRA
jgi:thymidylate kinase